MELKNVAAGGTITATGVATGALVFGAATAATTAGVVAYGVFAMTAAAVSLSSMTAWADEGSTDAPTYFKKVGQHAGYAVPAMVQFVTQMLFQAVARGVSDGVQTRVYRKISGEEPRG